VQDLNSEGLIYSFAKSGVRGKLTRLDRHATLSVRSSPRGDGDGMGMIGRHARCGHCMMGSVHHCVTSTKNFPSSTMSGLGSAAVQACIAPAYDAAVASRGPTPRYGRRTITSCKSSTTGRCTTSPARWASGSLTTHPSECDVSMRPHTVNRVAARHVHGRSALSSNAPPHARAHGLPCVRCTES
jgi:hypothetical protein